MTPDEHKFVSLPQFLQIVQSIPGSGWIYRGQTDISWSLLPKAGRPEYHLDATEYWAARGQRSSDLGRFSQWRSDAIAFCENLPDNEFESLAFAQHYGLATRLLDWTNNPMVALFFAVEAQGDIDGAVFCHFRWEHIDIEEAIWDHVRTVAIYEPRPFDRRILAQSGVFTYHPDPTQPLEAKPIIDEAKCFIPETDKYVPDGLDLVVIRVSAEMKPILQRQLSEIGMSRKTLFPDLEGLSEFINWGTRRSASYINKNKTGK